MKPFIFLLYCLFFNLFFAEAQKEDSALLKYDIVPALSAYPQAQLYITTNNKFLNADLPEPVNPAIVKKYNPIKNSIFYLLAGLLLLLGIIKVLFAKYFRILFRVFFNTSLRQSQLTDQLLIAKLPSLVFNIFFVISAGLYIYFVFLYFNWLSAGNTWKNILTSIATVGLIYIAKFLTLKFTGWVTGYKQEADTYIFIIFLINKIVGITLVPFTVIIAFSDVYLVQVAVIISLLVIAILLLLRFVRGYGLIRNNIKVNRFHFFIYIAGVEILPLLLVYKALLIFLTKNS